VIASEATDLDVGTPSKISGKGLMDEGLSVEIREKPDAAVIACKIVKSTKLQ
jgi:hypothetical protein